MDSQALDDGTPRGAPPREGSGERAEEPRPASAGPAAHGNFFDGRWHPLEPRSSFEALGPGRDEPERWPRSDARAVGSALDAALAAHPAWLRAGDGERARCLRDVLDELAGEDARDLARRMDLTPADLDWPSACEPAVPAGGVVLVRPDWTQLGGGAALALAHLAAGDTVAWLTDPALPELGELFARACERAGLPAGVLALLHDDTRDALRAAASRGALRRVHLSGPPRLVRELADVVRGAPVTAEDPRGAPFGEGVLEPRAVEVELEPLRSRSFVVRRGDDPAAAAREVLRRWLAPPALAGLRPGSVNRVLCHQRLFSAFTEALLAALENAPGPPWLPEDRDLLRRVARLVEAGLDEGATLVHEGWSEEPAGSRSKGRKARVRPIVFTNVEEAMGLARAGRPCPVLSLMRVESDEAGEALRRRLDGADGEPPTRGSGT